MSANDPKQTCVADRRADGITRIRVPRDGTNSENRRCCYGVVRAATGDPVAQRDYYLALALELLARADGEPDPERRAGLEALAASYRRMAEQAPHEAGRIIDVELPIEETKPSEK